MTKDPNEFVTIWDAYRDMRAANPSLPPLTPELAKLIEDQLCEQGAEQGRPLRLLG